MSRIDACSMCRPVGGKTRSPSLMWSNSPAQMRGSQLWHCGRSRRRERSWSTSARRRVRARPNSTAFAKCLEAGPQALRRERPVRRLQRARTREAKAAAACAEGFRGGPGGGSCTEAKAVADAMASTAQAANNQALPARRRTLQEQKAAQVNRPKLPTRPAKRCRARRGGRRGKVHQLLLGTLRTTRLLLMLQRRTSQPTAARAKLQQLTQLSAQRVSDDVRVNTARAAGTAAAAAADEPEPSIGGESPAMGF